MISVDDHALVIYLTLHPGSQQHKLSKVTKVYQLIRIVEVHGDLFVLIRAGAFVCISIPGLEG